MQLQGCRGLYALYAGMILCRVAGAKLNLPCAGWRQMIAGSAAPSLLAGVACWEHSLFYGQLVTCCTKRCYVVVGIALMRAIKHRLVLSARLGAVCALAWLLLNGSTASHMAMRASLL